MTTIYNYDPQTSEYLHESAARLDPLEGKPLIPADATTKVPPAVRQNEAAVFDGLVWKIVPDYRGLSYWLADKSEHSLEQLGVTPPDDALDAPPPPTLDELKQAATDSVIAFATDTRARITGRADPYKVAGWHDKSQRAQRVIANSASDTDIAILQVECNKRGKNETPQQLAQKQAAKGQALATSVAIIDGMESAALEAIESKRSENTLSALLDQLQTEANAELNRLSGE